jgi:sulfide:quinone oxidoreductase
MNQILILGGGFAGVEAAIKLRQKKYDVTLVSDRDYLFIYPISIWIPVEKKTFSEVSLPLSELSQKHGFKVVLGEVTKIDTLKSTVHISNGEIQYDYLILAMGMHKLGAPGIEHTHSICGKPMESLKIKDELDALVARGHGKIAIGFGGNPKDPTATAVRGGPAFELLFNISHFLKKKGIRDQFDINFFAPMKEPGKRMGDKPFQQLNLFFKRYKITQYVGKKIKRFEETAIIFEDDSQLESDLTIYISAGSGHKVIIESGLPITEAGFVKINELCRVQNHRNVYAIGDIAAITGPTWAAKQGHIAEIMADTAVYNMHNEIIGNGKRKSYWEHLNIICVMDSGDGAAFIKRTKKSEMIFPLPILGHWMKQAWGFYYINSKLKRIPRIPGM